MGLNVMQLRLLVVGAVLLVVLAAFIVLPNNQYLKAVSELQTYQGGNYSILCTENFLAQSNITPNYFFPNPFRQYNLSKIANSNVTDSFYGHTFINNGIKSCTPNGYSNIPSNTSKLITKVN